MKSKGRFSSIGEVVSFPNISRNDDQLLRNVLDNMAQGVLLLDSEMRMIFCNRRYLEMYSLPVEHSKPGCAILDLFRLRAKKTTSDNFKDYTLKLTQGCAEGKAFFSVANLVDGRSISVVGKPITGERWLTTHEDVSAQHRAQERIVHMARHDALTDLPNRILLRERLEHELKRVKRGECLAVMCLESVWEGCLRVSGMSR